MTMNCQVHGEVRCAVNLAQGVDFRPNDFLAEDYAPTECPEFMRFTLYFDGSLPSSAGSGKLADKRRIRERLHWQLLQLFRGHPALPKPQNGQDWSRWSEWKWPSLVLKGKSGSLPSAASAEWNDERVTVIEVGNLHFVPLVNPVLELICELDILFLRPGLPGLMERGQRYDVDNRLLTLFDALTVPKENAVADTIENTTLSPTSPIFCLLGDDERITAINVRTDSLLAKAEDAKDDHVRLIIGVTLRASRVTWVNRGIAE
jgi:hypothetical protein